MLEPANQVSGRVEGGEPGSRDDPVLAAPPDQSARLTLVLSEGLDRSTREPSGLGTLVAGLPDTPTLDVIQTSGVAGNTTFVSRTLQAVITTGINLP